MVEPMFHKEKIMTIGNILREIWKSVNKKSQMSLRDMLVLALKVYFRPTTENSEGPYSKYNRIDQIQIT